MGVRRLNARLDDELASKVRYIKRRTKQTDTAVIRTSLELYYQKLHHDEEARPYAALSELVGCAEGPADLSAEYKRLLAPSLERKL